MLYWLFLACQPAPDLSEQVAISVTPVTWHVALSPPTPESGPRGGYEADGQAEEGAWTCLGVKYGIQHGFWADLVRDPCVRKIYPDKP